MKKACLMLLLQILPPVADSANCAPVGACAHSCLGQQPPTGPIVQICDTQDLCNVVGGAGCCSVDDESHGLHGYTFLCQTTDVNALPTAVEFSASGCSDPCPDPSAGNQGGGGTPSGTTGGSVASSLASRVVLAVAGAALVRFS